MDNILEIIIPLVVAAIYFFGNMFSNKSDEDDGPFAPRGAADPEAAERQREVQEQLRRKIMERRQEAEGGASVAPSPPALNRPAPVVQVERRYDPHAPEVPVESSRMNDFRGVEEPDDGYESQIEQQLARIEATKRKAEQLKQQVAVSTVQQKSAWGSSISSSSRSSGLTGSVRSSLKRAGVARKAFVYSEVLGRPKSLRTKSEL